MVVFVLATVVACFYCFFSVGVYNKSKNLLRGNRRVTQVDFFQQKNASNAI